MSFLKDIFTQIAKSLSFRAGFNLEEIIYLLSLLQFCKRAHDFVWKSVVLYSSYTGTFTCEVVVCMPCTCIVMAGQN